MSEQQAIDKFAAQFDNQTQQLLFFGIDKPPVAITKDNIIKHLGELLINKKSYSQQLKEFSKLETALKNKGNFPSNLALNLIEKSLQTNNS